MFGGFSTVSFSRILISILFFIAFHPTKINDPPGLQYKKLERHTHYIAIALAFQNTGLPYGLHYVIRTIDNCISYTAARDKYSSTPISK
jgi:hypothetical protein